MPNDKPIHVFPIAIEAAEGGPSKKIPVNAFLVKLSLLLFADRRLADRKRWRWRLEDMFGGGYEVQRHVPATDLPAILARMRAGSKVGRLPGTKDLDF
jgi:hypothetical protein